MFATQPTTRSFAERRGFEPLIRFRRIRAFQARLFNHSSTSPRMGKDNDFSGNRPNFAPTNSPSGTIFSGHCRQKTLPHASEPGQTAFIPPGSRPFAVRQKAACLIAEERPTRTRRERSLPKNESPGANGITPSHPLLVRNHLLPLRMPQNITGHESTQRNHFQPLPFQIFQHRQRQLRGDTLSAEPIGNARMGNGDTPGTALLVIHRCRSTAQIEFITSERLIILQFILFHNHRILIVCKEEQNPHRNPHFGKEKTGPGDLPGPVSQSARIGYALPADPRTFSHLCM